MTFKLSIVFIALMLVFTGVYADHPFSLKGRGYDWMCVPGKDYQFTIDPGSPSHYNTTKMLELTIGSCNRFLALRKENDGSISIQNLASFTSTCSEYLLQKSTKTMCCCNGISGNGNLSLKKHFVREDVCGICPKEKWKSTRIIRGEVPLRDMKSNWEQFRRASRLIYLTIILYFIVDLAYIILGIGDIKTSNMGEYEIIFKIAMIFIACMFPCFCLYACCDKRAAGLKARFWHGFVEVGYECECEFKEGRRRFKVTYHSVYSPKDPGAVIRTQETKNPWHGHYKAPITRVMNRIDVQLPYNVIDRHFRTMPVYVGYFYTCKRWAHDLNKLLFHQSIESAAEEDHQRIQYAQFVKNKVKCNCSENSQYSTEVTLLQLHIKQDILKKPISLLFGDCWRKIAHLPPNPRDKPNHFAVQIDYECRDPKHPPGSPKQFTLTYEKLLRKAGTRYIEGRYENVFDDGTSKEVGKNIAEIKKLFNKIPRMSASISWAEAFYCEVCELNFGFGGEIV